MGRIRNNETERRIVTRYKHLYDRLFTAEEKKRIVLIVSHNQPELVGAEHLKRRLINNLYKP
jgi:hypothetical protein